MRQAQYRIVKHYGFQKVVTETYTCCFFLNSNAYQRIKNHLVGILLKKYKITEYSLSASKCLILFIVERNHFCIFQNKNAQKMPTRII